jgi:protein O-mannosyl-transferase
MADGARPWKWSAAVLAVALVSKGLALGAPFIAFDDGLYVLDNWKLYAPGLDGLRAIWSTADIGPLKSIEFFPLRDTVYWVLFKAFGAAPGPYHLVNLVLHLLVTWLALVLGRRLFTAEVAGFGALLFAAHPVHVESVSWVSGLKDPMFSTFTLLCLLAFLDWRKKGGALRYLAVMLGLVAALACKSLALGAPLVMLVMDRALPDRPAWKESLARVFGPALVSALALVFFVLLGRAALVLVPPHGGDWNAHAFLSAWAFVRYLQQAIAPHDLRLMYCFAPFEGATDLRWLGMAAVTAALGALAVWGRPRWALAVGATWFLAFILPALNLVPFPTLLQDRYLYLPGLAVCWGMAAVLMALPRRRTGTLLAGALVAAFSAQSLARALDWIDHRALFHEVAADPVCWTDSSPKVADFIIEAAAMTPDLDASFALLHQVADHPGFLRNDREVQCSQLTTMARAAMAAQRLEDARFFSQAVTKGCPEYLAGWQVLTQSALPSDPATAHAAAAYAYKLAPTHSSLFFRGLTQAMAGDSSGAADVETAARLGPTEVCAHLERYLKLASAEVRALLAPAAQHCGAR